MVSKPHLVYKAVIFLKIMSQESTASMGSEVSEVSAGSLQGCNWCFTLNNYTDQDEEMLRTLSWGTKYLVYGHEVGESGTPHLQGFVTFQTNQRFKAVKKFLPDGCHIEKARGTAWEAAQYCKKDDKGYVEEYGTCYI